MSRCAAGARATILAVGRSRTHAGGRVLLAVALALASVATPAHAHGLRLTVQADGTTVQGQAFYADGTPAAGNRVAVYAPADADEEAAATLTDADGRFRHDRPAGGALRVVVEGDEGHRAEAFVTIVPAAAAAAAAGGAGADRESSTNQASDSAPASGAELALRAAVRAELVPLQQQIDRLDQRIRLSDAVGGVGFLVGAAGLYALVRARRRA